MFVRRPDSAVFTTTLTSSTWRRSGTDTLCTVASSSSPTCSISAVGMFSYLRYPFELCKVRFVNIGKCQKSATNPYINRKLCNNWVYMYRMESKLASRCHLSSIIYIKVILCQLIYVRYAVSRHDNDNLPYVLSRLLFLSNQYNIIWLLSA